MIEIKNLHKSFDGKEVLKGITSTFESGKTNLIIGQSGSGKTVLIKNIVGLFEPTQGDVLYDGRSFMQMTKRERALLRREMGMIFQNAALFDSMSVLENVMFPLDMFSNDSYKEFSIYKGHHKKTNTTTTTTYKTVIVNGKTTTVKTVSGQNTTGVNTTKRIGFNNIENGFQVLNTCSKCSKYSIDCESVYIPNFGNNSIYTIKNFCPDCYQELGCVQCTTCKKHYYTNNITFYSDGRILCKECEEKATKNANSTSLVLVKP